MTKMPFAVCRLRAGSDLDRQRAVDCQQIVARSSCGPDRFGRASVRHNCYTHDAMSYEDIITVEPGKRGGQPCIRGIRITVYDVLSYLASGMTEEEILSDFPDLTHEDILACLAYAADRERKTRISHV